MSSTPLSAPYELAAGDLVFPAGCAQSPFVVLDTHDGIVFGRGDIAMSVRYALSGHVGRIVARSTDRYRVADAPTRAAFGL